MSHKQAVKNSKGFALFSVLLIVFLVLFAVLFVSSIGKNQTPEKSSAATPVPIAIGIIGDSIADEYRADDNRGGSTTYAATTLNWVELGDKYNRFLLGPWSLQSRGETRRKGYEYNWARSGALVHDIIAKGQVSGVVGQISQSKYKHVFIHVGSNDFLPANGITSQDNYGPIYYGTLSGSALQSKLDSIFTDIKSAVSSLLSAGASHIYIVDLSDPGASFNTQKTYSDATKRKRVTDAINYVNAKILTLSSSKVHIIDLDEFGNSLTSNLNQNNALVVGGQAITFTNGWEPTNLILGDGVHTGTVGSGLLLNFILSKISAFSGQATLPITTTEILAASGLANIPTPPPAPSLVTPSDGSTNINPTSLRIDWSDISGATNYKIQLYTDSSFSTGKVFDGLINTNVSTYQLSLNLKEGVTYYWRVSAVIGNTTSNWSNTYKFTTADVPTTPTLTSPLNNVLLQTQAVQLAWTASTSPTANGYQVQVSTKNGADFENAIIDDHIISSGSQLTYTTKELSRNTAYYWRVRGGTLNNVLSNWSTVSSFKLAPSAPTLLEPQNNEFVGSYYPILLWSQVSGASSYYLEMSYNSNMSSPFVKATVLSPKLSWQSTVKVPTERWVYWRMYATTQGIGNSSWSETRKFFTTSLMNPL